jgi:outer membrane protein OmpA-like peptidoglycan-associated protein
LEPSLRFAPFKSGLYLYAGPRVAFLMSKSFTYKHGINPAYPEQEITPDLTGDFNNMKNMLISMQIGAGYDIPLTSHGKQTQFVLSPFVSYHPYFGQEPRSIETWNITTVRAGIALKFGRGRKIGTSVKKDGIPVSGVVTEPKVKFTVVAPKNAKAPAIWSETFPIRNYVFFDLGSTEIPERYVLLQKDEVKEFKEDQLDAHASANVSGRSDRQMNAYYNILNILGNRMVENPSTTIMLVGSSEKGPQDGREMAESVKKYLVTIFEINASRITTQGRAKPSVPSEQPGGKLDLVLLREGDRRVTIESNSPVLLMEFRNGSDIPLKPVEIIAAHKAPVESYITFKVEDEKDAFTSWSLKTEDEQGAVKTFGPYTEEEVSIPTKSILGTRPEGDYKVTMIGQTKNGLTIERQTSAHMVLWTPAKTEESMRFSIIYEFNKSVAINIYEKYLLEVVTPKISDNATVIINGYTDIIGGEENNQKLSLARAKGVKRILEKGISKAGRKNVKFEVAGLSEDQSLSPFNNKYPEERFYNRTVIIDIIPRK